MTVNLRFYGGKLMNKECEGCAAINKCNVAVQPGSVMCQMYRLQSGQTKAELQECRNEHVKRCPHCGKLLN